MRGCDAVLKAELARSTGGALAMLAAMTTKRFRAMTSLSGTVDAWALADEPALIPFDPNDANKIRLRSPVAFPTSFKCPSRLYWGDMESWLTPIMRTLTARARSAGLDVEGVVVPGDHWSMTGPAIAKSIEFFTRHL